MDRDSKMVDTRCGFVSLLGQPNAGKSTLVNALVGNKVSIVTQKAQTSRFCTLGIVDRNETQIILVDPPGIFAPKRRLDRAMVKSAWTSVYDSDLVMIILDARYALDDVNRELIAEFAEKRTKKQKAFLLFNKIDLLPAKELLPVIKEVSEMCDFDKVFLISALTGKGTQELIDAIEVALPEGPWLYPADSLTTLTDRQMAGELIREQVFLQLHEELPYHATVEVEKYEERKDGSIKIDAVILVSRQSQKAIFVGERGQRLKSIGSRARAEISQVLGVPCHLFLTVKDRSGWDEETARLKAIGLNPTD